MVISEKLIDKLQVENTRVQFKQLTTVNPNYFGNMAGKSIKAKYKVVFPVAKNIKYEELTCVGLYPEDNLLEAVIEVKLPYGYKGTLCDAGSKEYVAFYIDYGDGNGFVSVGAASEVNVHDFPFVNGDHLYYAVRKAFTPDKYLKCNNPQIVKIRAILSWEKLPTGPDYVPVWGNVIDNSVQIKPKSAGFTLYPIPLQELKVTKKFDMIDIVPELEEVFPQIGPLPSIEKFVITGNKEEIKELIDRSIEAVNRIKAEGKVEEERFEFKNLIMQNPNYFGSISESKNKDEILKSVYELPQKTIEALLPKITIDPNWLVPVKPMSCNTNYEELTCVGLYPENDLLEAVIEVKRPYGFNGDLCTLGSTQYVAFYIDYGNGAGYQYVATATVGAYDIPEVSENHLFYAVKTTIPNIASELKNCSIDNIVKVKAILSWNEDPTLLGPTHTPVWGNAIERHIQIRPKNGLSVKCDIEIVNEIHTDDISEVGSNKGLGIKIDSSNNAVPGVFDRPFGGTIGCWGKTNVVGASYYRFRYSDDNGSSWKEITDKRVARHPSPWIATIDRNPDVNGWFSISEYNADVVNYSLAALVHWSSHGKNGDYILRLELADASKNPLLGQVSDIPIKLDNKGIEFFKFGGTPTPLPAEGIVVKDLIGNYKKCATFVASEEIKSFGNFRDDYFRNFSLVVFGGNLPVSGVGIGSGRYDSGILGLSDEGVVGAHDGGFGLELDSLNLCTITQVPDKVKCAYGIKLTVWDRAIVGYVSGYEFNTTRHGRHGYVTFNWDPTGC